MSNQYCPPANPASPTTSTYQTTHPPQTQQQSSRQLYYDNSRHLQKAQTQACSPALATPAFMQSSVQLPPLRPLKASLSQDKRPSIATSHILNHPVAPTHPILPPTTSIEQSLESRRLPPIALIAPTSPVTYRVPSVSWSPFPLSSRPPSSMSTTSPHSQDHSFQRFASPRPNASPLTHHAFPHSQSAGGASTLAYNSGSRESYSSKPLAITDTSAYHTFQPSPSTATFPTSYMQTQHQHHHIPALIDKSVSNISVASSHAPMDRTSASGSGLSDSVSKELKSRFRLHVRQQPVAARACGYGERDRRVIDPPPIIQFSINEFDPNSNTDLVQLRHPFNIVMCFLLPATRQEIDNEAESRRTGTNRTAEAADRPRVPSSNSGPSTHGLDITAVQERASQLKVTRRLMGTNVASPFTTLDPEISPSAMLSERARLATFFIFPDLSCRQNGLYRLRFTLMRTPIGINLPDGSEGDVYLSVDSNVFEVFSAKDFPGMRPSTFLTKELRNQGAAVSVKKGKAFESGTIGTVGNKVKARARQKEKEKEQERAKGIEGAKSKNKGSEQQTSFPDNRRALSTAGAKSPALSSSSSSQSCSPKTPHAKIELHPGSSATSSTDKMSIEGDERPSTPTSIADCRQSAGRGPVDEGLGITPRSKRTRSSTLTQRNQHEEELQKRPAAPGEMGSEATRLVQGEDSEDDRMSIDATTAQVGPRKRGKFAG